MSADEDDIIFTGESAEEAEDFIFAVKKRAYSKGKQKDNAWIADFVSICFAKKALRWYERLDEETQNDWKLLKRAILDEYEEASLPSSTVPTSASAVRSSVPKPVPAAAPPFRTGRIRVECDVSSLQGYIANTFCDVNWCTVSQNQSTAATFEFDAAARTIKFQGSTEDYLTVRAFQSNWDLRKGSNHFAALSKNSGRTVSAKSGWSNDIQVDLWSEMNGNKLIGSWPLKVGGSWELEASANKGGQKEIYLSPDYQAFATQHGANSFKALTLYFETLP